MGLFRRGPSRLERQLAAAALEDAMARAEQPIPAGAEIATRTGNVAHRKSALHPGAECEAMHEWTDWRIVRADEGLKPCHRCDLAIRRAAAS